MRRLAATCLAVSSWFIAHPIALADEAPPPTPPALAGAYQTVWSGGTVTYLSCTVGGVCGVALSTAAPTAYPPCAGAAINTMNLNATSASGQAMLKILTAAKAAGWQVNLYGYSGSSSSNYGSCTLASGTGQEDISWAQVH